MDKEQRIIRLLPVVIGVSLIAFGLFLLIDFFGRFIDLELVLRWWPVAVIGIGLVLVSKDTTKAFLGISLMLAGTVTLLARLGLLQGAVRDIIEIIVVLLVGLALVTPRILGYSKRKK